MISRFILCASLALMLNAAPVCAESSSRTIEVFKSATCGCCTAWIEHMQQAGFKMKAQDKPLGILAKIKRQAGLSPDLQSCHTAKVGGYVIEGHVPAEDVARLLKEKPDAVGLSVPGMPLGSPGMDFGPEKEPYDVLLVRKDGSTEVFARY